MRYEFQVFGFRIGQSRIPRRFSFEVDSLNPDSIPLNYDINVSEDTEIRQKESIDILDPNFVKPIRSLLKSKKRVHFCPQSTWYDLDGNIQTKPLASKYTLRYSLLSPSFSPCI